MAERTSATKAAKRPTKSTGETFTAEERAAMKARARELKNKADGESALLEAVAAMTGRDRAMAEKIHEIVTASAPQLSPKTWYGMPAYANSEGKVVCFFKPAQKFDSRYATFGFNDAANLDDGGMWPTSFALEQLSAADAAKIGALVKKAAR